MWGGVKDAGRDPACKHPPQLYGAMSNITYQVCRDSKWIQSLVAKSIFYSAESVPNLEMKKTGASMHHERTARPTLSQLVLRMSFSNMYTYSLSSKDPP